MENKETYKTVAGIKYDSGYEFLIQIKGIDRDLTEDEQDAFNRASDIIADALLKGNTGANPETHKKAKLNKLELMSYFGLNALYVEEISNGYCSRGCCAFYPWFVVTTPIGRIKIGWRKSVIHLEWTDSKIKADASEIFPHEEAWSGYETTQYDKVIHAHNYDAAKNYIDRLMNFENKS